MLFKRYEEVILRLEDLGSRMSKLSNNERQELQSLLEEQAWLGLTLVKKARSVMEEIDKNFEVLFDWMVLSTDLIDRAAEKGGRPDDVLRLKKVMSEAGSLKEQLKKLSISKNTDNRVQKEEQTEDAPVESVETLPTPVIEAVFEAAAAAEPVETVKPSVRPVKIKKVRKKKEKNKLNNKSSYKPPGELLNVISQRVAPSARRYVNLADLGAAMKDIQKPSQDY